MNFPSCSSNHEIRFHLHLSSNEESQKLSNPILSKSQPQPLPDSKLTPEENPHELNQNPTPQKGNSGISSHEPLISKGQNGKNPKSRKDNITDAVELAVAASEALIIHEIIKNEPNTQLSTPSSVLEASKDAHQKTTNNSSFLSDIAPDTPPSVSPMEEDLLCSIVPCSFSSDNTLPQINLNNPKSISPQNADFLHENTRPIQRHVSSLKTYSILSYPPYDPYSDKQPTTQDEKKTKLPSTTINNKENPELLKSCLVPMRKRVRFSEPEIIKKSKKHRVTFTHNNKTFLFRDLKFLITGFSIKKHKEIKNLIQKNGGIVLDDIPSPPTSRQKRSSKHRIPIILSPKRLLTTKFLYGCAVNACILKVKWLFDSVNEGSILRHKKYMILKEHVVSCGVIIGMPLLNRSRFIFESIAIMLHGKHDFCMKMGKVIKHGGGLVFKTFHWLVKRVETNRVLIVVEDENGISRQLKQCAIEQDIEVMSFDWIVKSLYAGRVLPSPQFKNPSSVNLELSEEI